MSAHISVWALEPPQWVQREQMWSTAQSPAHWIALCEEGMVEMWCYHSHWMPAPVALFGKGASF